MKRLILLLFPLVCLAKPPSTPSSPGGVTNVLNVTNWVYVTNYVICAPTNGMWITNLNVYGAFSVVGTNDGLIQTFSTNGTLTGHLP